MVGGGRALLAAGAAALLVAGCGGGSGSAQPTVYAAASLTQLFQRLDPRARFSFAGSDTLVEQIREGAPADVFASANTRYPRQLYRAGLLDRPRVFAVNHLELAVPAANPAGIHGLADLRRPGVKVVIAARGVPVGDYTRRLLARLHEDAILRNVVSEETDVKVVLAKVALGEADAGFVYATDIPTAKGKVKGIPLPGAQTVSLPYAVGVLKHAKDPAAARAFVALLLGPKGRSALAAAGFGLP